MNFVKFDNINLPNKWQWVQLGDIFKLTYGASLPTRKRVFGNIPVFGSNGIVGYHNKSLIPGPAIILGRKGSIGEVNISNDSCWPIDTTYYLSNIRSDIHFGWLVHCLKILDFKRLNKAAAVPGLNRNDVYSLRIPLPSLSIQKKIAAVLDKADRLRQLRKTAIEKLDQLTQSVFLHIFFSEKSERQGLPVVQIEDIALKEKGSMRTGPFGSDLLHSEFVDNGIAVLGIDNAVNNKFEWGERRYISKEKYKKLKRYTIYPGDVIVTIMGTTGRSAVIPQNIPLAINTKHLAAITLDKGIVNPYFISYSIHSDPFILNQIKLRDRGAIMSGLNLTIIKNLKIKLPPLNMQNKFASILQKIEKQQEAMKVSSKKMDENFNSILQRAFKGELAFNDDYFKRLGQNTGDYS